MEEYLDYLKEEESISASIEGEKYTMSYYPFFQRKTIDVEIPVKDMGGVIMTTRS
ncbi:hypothetical protein bcere0005_54270 [Bacillus cereus 172560W]|nr:hypothetical protein bcere0005_54270 [Bacillus cereus 172560W]